MGEGEGGLSMPSDHSMWGGGSLNVGTPPPPVPVLKSNGQRVMVFRGGAFRRSSSHEAGVLIHGIGAL